MAVPVAITAKYTTSDPVWIFNEKGESELTSIREVLISGEISAPFDNDDRIKYYLNAIDDEGFYLIRIEKVIFATQAEALAYVTSTIPV